MKKIKQLAEIIAATSISVAVIGGSLQYASRQYIGNIVDERTIYIEEEIGDIKTEIQEINTKLTILYLLSSNEYKYTIIVPDQS